MAITFQLGEVDASPVDTGYSSPSQVYQLTPSRIWKV